MAYYEDEQHRSGAKGTLALVVRKDTGATLADTDGDYTPLQADADGKLRVASDTELPAAVALSDALPNPTVPGVGAYLLGWDGTQWVRVDVATGGKLIAAFGGGTAIGDGYANGVAPTDTAGTGRPLAILPMLNNGATLDRQRTPSVFKTVAAVAVTAGTPVAGWTPAAGKKFRCMGYALSLSVAGAVILKDATTELIRTPLMLAGDGHESPPMGNGILSATANNVLNIDVTATGTVSGFLFGTEE